MKNDPFHATCTLRQHTPMIHFQHDQPGATLRASDLKPRLDKFLLRNKAIPIRKEWLLKTPNEAVKALNYQVQVMPVKSTELKFYDKRGEEVELAGYFGNMSNESDNKKHKKYVMANGQQVELQFFFPEPELKELVEPQLADFFSWHNFGTRQTKGFGCFYIDSTDIAHYKLPIHFLPYHFSIDNVSEEDFEELFKCIDLFYRTLRGGINLKKVIKDNAGKIIGEKDVFYFKSLLFKYATDGKENQWKQAFQWEKKTIKQTLLENHNETKRQATARTDNDNNLNSFNEALWFNRPEKRLLKDLLGLATEETWKAKYNVKITKTHTHENTLTAIDRFASPILFKPIWGKNANGKYGWTIYFGVKPDAYKFEESSDSSTAYFGQEFILKKDGRAHPDSTLSLPDKFDVNLFLKYIFDTTKFNIATHVETIFQNTAEYKLLKGIYQQLQTKKANA